MKRVLLLLGALLCISVSSAQNRISFCDICGVDSENPKFLFTYSLEDMIKNLARKGFVITNTEYAYGEGAGGAIVPFKLVTMYQRSTNTKVYIDSQGPGSIYFNSVDDAYQFAAEADYLGYVKRNGSHFQVTFETIFGVDGFSIKGRELSFEVSVP